MEHLYEEILDPTRDNWQHGFLTRALAELSKFGLLMEFSGAFVRGHWDGKSFVEDPRGACYKAAVLAMVKHH